jgi:hypothetical protein
MNLLNKEDLIRKLSPYGIKSVQAINRLIREQGLPTKYFSPRKMFFEEGEVDTWLLRRSLSIALSNTTHTKVIKAQRKRRKDATPQDETLATQAAKAAPAAPEIKPFKKQEA